MSTETRSEQFHPNEPPTNHQNEPQTPQNRPISTENNDQIPQTNEQIPPDILKGLQVLKPWTELPCTRCMNKYSKTEDRAGKRERPGSYWCKGCRREYQRERSAKLTVAAKDTHTHYTNAIARIVVGIDKGEYDLVQVREALQNLVKEAPEVVEARKALALAEEWYEKQPSEQLLRNIQDARRFILERTGEAE